MHVIEKVTYLLLAVRNIFPNFCGKELALLLGPLFNGLPTTSGFGEADPRLWLPEQDPGALSWKLTFPNLPKRDQNARTSHAQHLPNLPLGDTCPPDLEDVERLRLQDAINSSYAAGLSDSDEVMGKASQRVKAWQCGKREGCWMPSRSFRAPSP